ncbi:MAG: tetratricopeptide repeat protein [candidate division Zixibacteria bacterium]|nr:tetratricopeptide repeat protein [candidate division Zixibacteria bacterium]
MRTKIIVISLLAFALMITACADKNLRQGKIMLQQDPPNYEGAIEQFEKSIETKPTAEAYLLLGETHARLEQYSEMNEALIRALELDPESKVQIDDLRNQESNKVWNRAGKDLNAENYSEALDKYETCIMIQPSNVAAYSNAAFCAKQLGMDDKAYEYYKTAYEMDPDDFDNVRNFAATCFSQEKYEEALEVYRVAFEKRPDNANIPIRMGQIYERMEDYEKAIEVYDKALEIDPNNGNLWFNMGVMYIQRLQDYENANEAFKKAMEINPEDYDAAFNRGLALLNMKEYEEALGVVEKLIELNPDNCDSYDMLVSVHAGLGNNDAVNAAIKKGKDCRGE